MSAPVSKRPASEAAREIYQAHLDSSTPLVLAGRAEEYCVHARLPYVFLTAAKTEVIETQADLERDILEVHTWLKHQNVSDFHRIARVARFLDDATIEGFHVTYALRGATPVVEPYTSRMILKRTDTMWQTSRAEHELAGALYPGHHAVARPGTFQAVWSEAPDAVTRDQSDASPIYQDVLSAMDTACNSNDFDAWKAQFTLPYTTHHAATDHVIEDADAARAFFSEVQQALVEAGADRLRRTAHFATFIADDRILGYHETRMMKDGETRFGPIKSRMIMTLAADRWKCMSVTNSLANSGFPNGAFALSDDLPTLREIQKRMQK